jgi:acyl-CoA synthetase (AMP-forming)/AMP-acid ligase II
MNQIEFVISFLATMWLGVTAAPVTAGSSKSEFEHVMRNLATGYLLVPGGGHPLIESVATELGVRRSLCEVCVKFA